MCGFPIREIQRVPDRFAPLDSLDPDRAEAFPILAGVMFAVCAMTSVRREHCGSLVQTTN
jgi:hypothetical protein